MHPTAPHCPTHLRWINQSRELQRDGRSDVGTLGATVAPHCCRAQGEWGEGLGLPQHEPPSGAAPLAHPGGMQCSLLPRCHCGTRGAPRTQHRSQTAVPARAGSNLSRVSKL